MSPPRRRSSPPASLAEKLELAGESDKMSPFHTQLHARHHSDLPPDNSSSSDCPFVEEAKAADPSALLCTSREWRYEDDSPCRVDLTSRHVVEINDKSQVGKGSVGTSAGSRGRSGLRKVSFSSTVGRRLSRLSASITAEFARRQDSVDSFMSEPVSYGEENYMSQDLWITRKNLGMVSGDRPTSGVKMSMEMYTSVDKGTALEVDPDVVGRSFSYASDLFGKGTSAERRRKKRRRRILDDAYPGGFEGGERGLTDLSGRLKPMLRWGEGSKRRFRSKGRAEEGTFGRDGIHVTSQAADYHIHHPRPAPARESLRRKSRFLGSRHRSQSRERSWSSVSRRRVKDKLRRWFRKRRVRADRF